MKRSAAAAIAFLVLLVIATAGVYAYNGTLSIGGNSLSAESYSIDIVDENGDEISAPITFTAPSHEGTNITQSSATVSAKLVVDWNGGNAQLRAWFHMPPQSWTYIDRIVLSIGGNNYLFNQGSADTGNPTQLIPNIASGTHAFTLTFYYNDTVPALLDDQGHDIFGTLPSFTFAAGSADPFSS